jgi:hypothetical protein
MLDGSGHERTYSISLQASGLVSAMAFPVLDVHSVCIYRLLAKRLVIKLGPRNAAYGAWAGPSCAVRDDEGADESKELTVAPKEVVAQFGNEEAIP